ncbi:membrane protein [Labrys miyagiensis]
MSQDHHYAPISPFRTGPRGLCPRCGQGKMFAGFISLKPKCSACGLDYSFADSGDGPAVLVILVAGFIILGLALYVEFTFSPPIWVHILLWLPLSLIVCLSLLRVMKGILVALQYTKQAAEGRLE